MDELYSFDPFASPDSDDEESESSAQNAPSQQQSITPYPSIKDLSDAIQYLSQPLDRSNLHYIEYVISTYMGSMAQCRVHGKEINRLGGIEYLMTILYNLIGYWSLGERQGDIIANAIEDLQQSNLELQVGNATLGALRDLSCGNASNRRQIGQYDYQIHGHAEAVAKFDEDVSLATWEDIETKTCTGIHIISFFITKHARQKWEEIPKLELKGMTNALGVTRNITHSSSLNCQALHKNGMTRIFMNRLCGILNGSENVARSESGKIGLYQSLPDVSKPWREACYRLAGTLINMAEKCRDAAIECASDEVVIWILIDSWGGIKDWNALFGLGDLKKAIPVLHLGLFAVLMEKLRIEGGKGDEIQTQVMDEARARWKERIEREIDEDNNLNQRIQLDMIHGILESERKRKRRAQERENARKANTVKDK
eukprot:scaffold654_cov253-Chaetoceros_neogracile.AAC.4